MRGGPDPRSNMLLAALPPGELDHVLEAATPVHLEARNILAHRGAPLDRVLFPLNGILSLVATMLDGAGVEIATVGREGVVGVPSVLRQDPTSPAEVVVQVECDVLIMPAQHFRAMMKDSGRMPELVQRFNHALFEFVAQNVACNRLHDVESRLSRWLLTTQDRIDSDQLPLTHEFLSQMLGVRRASVTEAAGALAERGLIRYRRGSVAVLDRKGLESAACECHSLIRGVFEGLYV